MNLLSNTVIAFVPRRSQMAATLRAVARDTSVKSRTLVCRWDRSPITGRLNCVWTSLDVAGEAEVPTYLRLAS